MPSIYDVPPEIISLVCEYLLRPDLRNIRLVNRDFNVSAQRVLFRTIFLKVNHPSFDRLWNISEHKILRRYVEVITYGGRELESPNPNSFKGWLRYRGAEGLGLFNKREEFLVQFSGQLRNYYGNFVKYSGVHRPLSVRYYVHIQDFPR